MGRTSFVPLVIYLNNLNPPTLALTLAGVPCGEYLFDHRNSSMSDWLVQEFLLGSTGLGPRCSIHCD